MAVDQKQVIADIKDLLNASNIQGTVKLEDPSQGNKIVLEISEEDLEKNFIAKFLAKQTKMMPAREGNIFRYVFTCSTTAAKMISEQKVKIAKTESKATAEPLKTEKEQDDKTKAEKGDPDDVEPLREAKHDEPKTETNIEHIVERNLHYDMGEAQQVKHIYIYPPNLVGEALTDILPTGWEKDRDGAEKRFAQIKNIHSFEDPSSPNNFVQKDLKSLEEKQIKEEIFSVAACFMPGMEKIIQENFEAAQKAGQAKDFAKRFQGEFKKAMDDDNVKQLFGAKIREEAKAKADQPEPKTNEPASDPQLISLSSPRSDPKLEADKGTKSGVLTEEERAAEIERLAEAQEAAEAERVLAEEKEKAAAEAEAAEEKKKADEAARVAAEEAKKAAEAQEKKPLAGEGGGQEEAEEEEEEEEEIAEEPGAGAEGEPEEPEAEGEEPGEGDPEEVEETPEKPEGNSLFGSLVQRLKAAGESARNFRRNQSSDKGTTAAGKPLITSLKPESDTASTSAISENKANLSISEIMQNFKKAMDEHNADHPTDPVEYSLEKDSKKSFKVTDKTDNKHLATVEKKKNNSIEYKFSAGVVDAKMADVVFRATKRDKVLILHSSNPSDIEQILKAAAASGGEKIIKFDDKTEDYVKSLKASRELDSYPTLKARVEEDAKPAAQKTAKPEAEKAKPTGPKL